MNFRVADVIGKHIKPNTEIIALLDNNAAYIIKDLTNNKVYGKPKSTYIIAILFLLAFNSYMYYMNITGQKDIFVSYKQVMIIGNIVFGFAFLFSFTSFF